MFNPLKLFFRGPKVERFYLLCFNDFKKYDIGFGYTWEHEGVTLEPKRIVPVMELIRAADFGNDREAIRAEMDRLASIHMDVGHTPRALWVIDTPTKGSALRDTLEYVTETERDDVSSPHWVNEKTGEVRKRTFNDRDFEDGYASRRICLDPRIMHNRNLVRFFKNGVELEDGVDIYSLRANRVYGEAEGYDVVLSAPNKLEKIIKLHGKTGGPYKDMYRIDEDHEGVFVGEKEVLGYSHDGGKTFVDFDPSKPVTVTIRFDTE